MSDLPQKQPERAPQEESPMTTLTLSAGLPNVTEQAEKRQAETGRGRVAKAGERRSDAPEQIDQTAAEQVPVGQMDDHALLAATRSGDEAAFAEIVRRYKNLITNFVYRMLNDYDRAVDLAQETFVRVYMNAERYQANYSFSTYIYRIASNLAISELRQRKRRRLIPIPTFFSDKENEEVEIDMPDRAQKSAEQAMIEDERRQAVARAITSLPEKYRTVIVLRDIEGRSYEEISAILDMSDGTVKSRINRARNLLKEKLKDYL